MDLQSYGRCSRNENGHEEVDAHFHQTLWQWLTMKPATRKVWYSPDNLYWFDKETGKLASRNDHALIAQICYELNRIKCP